MKIDKNLKYTRIFSDHTFIKFTADLPKKQKIKSTLKEITK